MYLNIYIYISSVTRWYSVTRCSETRFICICNASLDDVDVRYICIGSFDDISSRDVPIYIYMYILSLDVPTYIHTYIFCHSMYQHIYIYIYSVTRCTNIYTYIYILSLDVPQNECVHTHVTSLGDLDVPNTCIYIRSLGDIAWLEVSK